MSQQRQWRWKALLVSLALGLPLWVQAQAPQLPITPLDAHNLAAANLNRVLEWLPPDHLELYGFADKDDLSAISIGKPLYLHAFSDESVIAGSDARMQTPVVQLPLLLNGTTRCFIYLSPDEEGRWTASGLGGHNEAQAWDRLFTGKDAAAQDHLDMLHIPQTNTDFLLQQNNSWLDVSVGPNHNNGAVLHTDQVFAEAVRIAAEARATVKEDAGS